MAKQSINIGHAPNDGTGDSLRTGASKINDNFTEVYNRLFTPPLSMLALLNTLNSQRITEVSGEQWEFLKQQDQSVSKNSPVEFARLKLTGTDPDLIGPSDWLIIEGNKRKFYASEIEINNLLQPISPLEVILSEPLINGIKPIGWQDNNITWQTSDGGYALFSNSGSYLVSPTLDLSNKIDLRIEFEVAKYGSGNNGPLLVEFSYDAGITWEHSEISEIPSSSTYLNSFINIPISSSNFKVRFLRSLSPSQKRLRNILIKARNTTFDGDRFVARVIDNDLMLGTLDKDALSITNDGDVNIFNDFILHSRFISKTFNSGWNGVGFKLEKNDGHWDLELDSVTIRKYLRAYELLIEKIRVQLGSRALSAGGGTISKVEGVSPDEILTFEDPDNYGATSFAVDDIILTQSVRTDRSTLLKYIARKIVSVNGLEVGVAKLTGAPSDTGVYEVGDDVIVIGNLTNSERQALIYESVTDSGAPFYRIMDDISDYDEFLEINNLKLQLGKLSDLLINDVQLEGYGIMSQNSYFTGEFIVGDLSRIDNYLRFHNNELHGDFKNISFKSDEFLLNVPNLHINSSGASPTLKLGENAAEMELFMQGIGFYVDGNANFRFGEIVNIDESYILKRGLIGMDNKAVFHSIGGGETINYFTLQGVMEGFQFGFIDNDSLDDNLSSYLWLDTGMKWDDYNYIINRVKLYGEGTIPLSGMRVHFGDEITFLKWDQQTNKMRYSGELEGSKGTIGDVVIPNDGSIQVLENGEKVILINAGQEESIPPMWSEESLIIHYFNLINTDSTPYVEYNSIEEVWKLEKTNIWIPPDESGNDRTVLALFKIYIQGYDPEYELNGYPNFGSGWQNIVSESFDAGEVYYPPYGGGNAQDAYHISKEFILPKPLILKPSNNYTKYRIIIENDSFDTNWGINNIIYKKLVPTATINKKMISTSEINVNNRFRIKASGTENVYADISLVKVKRFENNEWVEKLILRADYIDEDEFVSYETLSEIQLTN